MGEQAEGVVVIEHLDLVLVRTSVVHGGDDVGAGGPQDVWVPPRGEGAAPGDGEVVALLPEVLPGFGPEHAVVDAMGVRLAGSQPRGSVVLGEQQHTLPAGAALLDHAIEVSVDAHVEVEVHAPVHPHEVVPRDVGEHDLAPDGFVEGVPVGHGFLDVFLVEHGGGEGGALGGVVALDLPHALGHAVVPQAEHVPQAFRVGARA